MTNKNKELQNSSNQGNVYKLPNGMSIHHLNRSETNFLYKEIFENNSYMKHGISLQEGALVFDVGANIGIFTLFIKSTIKKSRVFAFEPIPEICQVLRLNTAQFNSDVVVYEFGLSNENKAAIMTYYPGYTILSGLYADFDEDSRIFLSGAARQWRSTQKKRVEMPDRVKEILVESALSREVEHVCKLTTISSIIREQDVSQIDLLKIDVEKSELDIMNGIDPADWPRIKQIVMEIHDFDGILTEEINTFLKDMGFRTKIEYEEHFGSALTPNIYAIRE